MGARLPAGNHVGQWRRGVYHGFVHEVPSEDKVKLNADPEDRRVVYASPADDVAANMDLARQTVEACKLILVHTNWQIRLLSKSTFLPQIAAMLADWSFAARPDVYGRVIFGVSTGTFHEGAARAIEAGTPSVTRRIQSLHVLQDNGFRTFAMVCPSLPCESPADYAAFAKEAAARLRYDRCEHVWAEVINLRGESFKRTFAALREAGLEAKATAIDMVSHDGDAWENYNRATFLAHAKVCEPYVGKLRFLTYAKPSTRGWWEKHIARGAVIL